MRSPPPPASTWSSCCPGTLYRAAELAGDLPTTLLAVKEAAVLAALVVGLQTRTAYRNLPNALHTTAATGAAGPGFGEAYRRLLDPTADPAVQVLALGRVRDACWPWPTGVASRGPRRPASRRFQGGVVGTGVGRGPRADGAAGRATAGASSTRRPWR